LKQGQDVLDENGNVIYRIVTLRYLHESRAAYAYCSDTEFDKNFIEQINKVDLLYHEATFVESDEPKARETKHSTAKQAATIAQLAGGG
jgi:ribonuclease Z